MKYIKLPVVIEAIEWTGKNHRPVFEFMGGRKDEAIKTEGDDFFIDHKRASGGLIIKTSEGEMVASIGDYIIKEPFDKDRKFYPCKPDIFAKTYEAVS